MINRFNYPENPVSDNSGITVEFLKENGAVYWLQVGDDVHVVYDFGYNGRLCMSATFHGYEDFFCFGSVELAVQSLDNYAKEIETNSKAEPFGWHRHSATGRRRTNGDPTTEYINF